jgi:hypothetical protein
MSFSLTYNGGDPFLLTAALAAYESQLRAGHLSAWFATVHYNSSQGEVSVEGFVGPYGCGSRLRVEETHPGEPEDRTGRVLHLEVGQVTEVEFA